MRHFFTPSLVFACFSALFLACYAPTLFHDRQLGFRDSAHYYYPLNQRVQEEWNANRWPLWEPEENAGMPLMGNPTAAVLYPGKLVFATLPYAWAAKVYIVGHSALAFFGMLVLMRGLGITWFGSGLGSLAYAFGGPVLFQYCNVIYLVAAAWLPLGVLAVDRWIRQGKRWALLGLALVLSMQVLGGDPEAAYLLGLAGVGYAVGLAWQRRRLRQVEPGAGHPPSRGIWTVVAFAALGLAIWVAVTLVLAQWLPKLRETGKPTPPFFWMAWVPLCVVAAWGLFGLGFLIYWAKRGWRSPLGSAWMGLAASAALASALTAAQLLPVVEFTQRTTRVAEGGTHDFYPFSVEPYRMIEMIWSNVLGTQFAGNDYWGAMIHVPGARPKPWVASHYLGGLTLALALISLTFRHGPPWRVWFTVIVVVSLLGSLGKYTSPIWVTRVIAECSPTALPQSVVTNLGPIDPIDDTPIRRDGYLRDGDGGIYWILAHLLPGFRQFRFPAKLFTFTTLALAALAGAGWDRMVHGHARRARVMFFLLLAVTLATLIGVLWQRDPILKTLSAIESHSLWGPFDAEQGFEAIVRSLGQAAIVFTLGLVSVILGRTHPLLAGSLALIVMTADLGLANVRTVLTVPQSVFDTKPQVLKIIEDAERASPTPGPYRIHRMPIWNPVGWMSTASKDRNLEMVMWEHNTIQPKYGITEGVEYTHTMGVAEVYDFEWYFNGFPWKVHNPQVAQSLGVELEKEVVYYPRRSFDMWNTRYFIVPYWHGGWRDENRGFASLMFDTKRVYPGAEQFSKPAVGKDAEKNWVETNDFRILRNLEEYPRAWVVHDARATMPFKGLSPETRREAMEEIIYDADPIWYWRDNTHKAYDPRQLAWVGQDDLLKIRGRLSGQHFKTSEKVDVSYPNPQQAVLEVTVDSPGLVVLSDIFYPGWELKIDDQPAPIYRVNGVMRGALVSKGYHRLVFDYVPKSFHWGLRVSAMAIGVFSILCAACVRWPVDALLAEGNGS